MQTAVTCQTSSDKVNFLCFMIWFSYFFYLVRLQNIILGDLDSMPKRYGQFLGFVLGRFINRFGYC